MLGYVKLFIRTGALSPDLCKPMPPECNLIKPADPDAPVDDAWVADALATIKKAQALGRAAIVHWEGVIDCETGQPLPVTPDWIDCVMATTSGLAAAFVDRCADL